MIVDVDAHVVEPADLWSSRLPAKYSDVGPRIKYLPGGEVKLDGSMYIEAPGTEGPDVAWWFYEDRKYSIKRLIAASGFPPDEITMDGVTYEEIRAGCYRQADRIADNELNGVEAQMCYPNYPRFCGQIFLWGKDKELSLLCVQAYNDWMVEEWCGGSGGRLIPLCLVPLWDAELAAAEVRRNAARGVRAVAFSELPTYLDLPSIHSGYWDPFFRACEEEGTVVCIHIGSNSKAPTTSPDAPVELIYTLSPIGSFEAAGDILWSKLFLRFPRLKLALSEGGIGWVPYFLERVDYLYRHTQHWSGMDLGGRLPSELWSEHVVLCFIDDLVGAANLDKLNIDNVTWECDYPHSDTTWPQAPEKAMRHMDGLPDEVINKITHLNAMKQFSYDPFAHVPREQATVGALRGRVPDWDVSTKPTAHLRPEAAAR
jgi:predicted TIM-barrel fold metal-dependent hydrolase